MFLLKQFSKQPGYQRKNWRKSLTLSSPAMNTLERVFKQGGDEATYEAIKNLLKEGLITDVERLRWVFKLSKKKMEEFLKRIQSEK